MKSNSGFGICIHPPHPIHPDYVGAIRSLIQAFRRAEGTKSGLIFTSRDTFHLKTDSGNDLADYLCLVPLGPMKRHDGLKQVDSKARKEGLPMETIDTNLTERIVQTAQGNPGLQDLLFSMYLNIRQQSERNPKDPAASFQPLINTLKEMEAYIDERERPKQQDLLRFFKNLAIDRMLALLGDGERKLLEASTLFKLPVPVDILKVIAEQCGYYAGKSFGTRIFGLGMWEQFEDLVNRNEIAASANALTLSRLSKLSEEDTRTLASMVINPLFDVWGGKNGANRPLAADWELSILAQLAESAEIIAHTAADALRFLDSQYLNRMASTFAVDSISLLEKAQIKGTSDFYHMAGKIFHATGKSDLALSCIERALTLFGPTDEKDKSKENYSYASILLTQAQLIMQKGEVNAAVQILQEAERRFDAIGSKRDKLIALGYIARIKVDKGDVDAALKLHEEMLEVMQNLGDLDGIANTLWSIAKIDIAKQDHQKAYERLSESYQINMKLGRLDGICFVGFDLGKILCGGGHKDEGFKILKRSRDGFIQLGQQQLAQQINQLIDYIEDKSS